MRLLQLATGPNEILDLHPTVSVVTGLDDVGHSTLLDAVTRLARAEAAPVLGTLEAHGILFDLDPDLLALLDAAPADIDPVVQAVQLPAQPISLADRELRAREDAFAVLLELISVQAEKQSVARSTLARASEALERAHAARAAAAAGGERRQENLERAARRLESLTDERGRIRRDVEEARHVLVTARAVNADVLERTKPIREAGEASSALRASIEDEVADDLAVAAAAPPPTFDPPVIEDQAGVEVVSAPIHEARVRELEQLLLAVAPVERIDVEEAVAQLLRVDGVEPPASPEAQRIADELDQIAASLGQQAQGDDLVGPVSLEEARAHLEDARRGLHEADQAVRTPDLDRDDILKLEDVHGELIEAIDKAEGRFGRSRSASRVVELRAAEQEILDRLGFTSYSAYMMGYSLNHTDPVKEAQLDQAREQLAAAEDVWSDLQGASEEELEVAALRHRRQQLLEIAQALLGQEAGAAPQEALRALRVPVASARDAAAVLRVAVNAVGVDLGEEEMEDDELVLIAQQWLAEAERADERRRAATAELAELREGAIVEPPSPAPDAPPSFDAASLVTDRPVNGRLAALQADLATALEMEQSAHASAAAAAHEIASAVAEVASLEATVHHLELELARADADVAEAEEALSGVTAESDLPDLDQELDSAKAVHADALAALELIDHTMATLDAEGRTEALEIERLQDLVAAEGTGSATPAEELEWYLLARLAAQRSVSVAGSVPLLLDDALRGLGIDEVCHLLTRLERMADVVQVIVISEDPVVASWAVTTGMARAAVVAPVPV